MKAIKNIIRKLLNAIGMGGIVQLAVNSYLTDKGWFNSFKAKRSIGVNGEPVPWLTYPFMRFMEERLDKSFRLFEFGSGNSTLWFSKRLEQVTSVEHNEAWYREIKHSIPENVRLAYEPLENGKYSLAAKNSGEQFDIIIVDGRDRVNCIKNSWDMLSPSGILILDNSEVPDYAEGIAFLKGKNFKVLDFEGMTPGIPTVTQTSVFYKDGNIFGI